MVRALFGLLVKLAASSALLHIVSKYIAKTDMLSTYENLATIFGCQSPFGPEHESQLFLGAAMILVAITQGVIGAWKSASESFSISPYQFPTHDSEDIELSLDSQALKLREGVEDSEFKWKFYDGNTK